MKKLGKGVLYAATILYLGIIPSCIGNGNSEETNTTISPADTVFMGDLKSAFTGDTIFFAKVAPNICLIQNLYLLTMSQSEAAEKGVSKELYRKVQEEITKTNEIIKKGVMKGGDIKKIYDFQEHYFEK